MEVYYIKMTELKAMVPILYRYVRSNVQIRSVFASQRTRRDASWYKTRPVTITSVTVTSGPLAWYYAVGSF